MTKRFPINLLISLVSYIAWVFILVKPMNGIIGWSVEKIFWLVVMAIIGTYFSSLDSKSERFPVWRGLMNFIGYLLILLMIFVILGTWACGMNSDC